MGGAGTARPASDRAPVGEVGGLFVASHRSEEAAVRVFAPPEASIHRLFDLAASQGLDYYHKTKPRVVNRAYDTSGLAHN